MRHETLKELLTKYREKRCTLEDITILKQLFNDEKQAQALKKVLYDDLESFQIPENREEVDFDRIFTSIKSGINFEYDHRKIAVRKLGDPVRKTFTHLMRIVAVLLFGFLCGGLLVYFFIHPSDIHSVSYCEVSVPLGAKSDVVLPDGSRIWLNAGSKIRYASDFNQNSRNISLQGEAYFKVAKNKQLPFIVQVNGLHIRAVGTEFNVKAYDNDGIVETTLIEGKITLKNTSETHASSNEVALIPNQKAVFVKDKGSLLVKDLSEELKETKKRPVKDDKIYILEKIDPLPVISWKDSRLVIRSETLENLAVKLGRKYNVHFVFSTDEVKQFKFTGTLEDETLQQVLDVIKLSAPIRYQMNGKTVTLFEDKSVTNQFIKHMTRK